MEFDITLNNYRCFSDARPVTIELRKGLTAFVGPNNSGKSALLRFFYEFRPFFEQAQSLAALQQMLLNGNAAGVNMQSEVLDYEELFSFTNDHELRVAVAPKDGPLVDYPSLITAQREAPQMKMEIRSGPPQQHGNYGFRLGQKVVVLPQFQETFGCLADAIYIGAFRNALNKGEGEQKYFDISVGQRFISEWADYQTGNIKRLNKAAARVVDHIQEIFGFKNLAITAAPQNQKLNFVINGRPLKDHEVGSGLTQVLMVLATVAIKRPSYILIDEPELNLHPSLQVKFLMALASYARDGVLFGTHSIGLARTVADRIFSAQQVEEGQSEIKKYGDTQNLAELLGEMSFSAYKDMGFDEILLVEGRTDVRVVQQFLRLLKKDHRVVPVPLGGGAMICPEAEHELAELGRLCNSVHALIDSERTAEGAAIEPRRQGFLDACQRLHIRCKVLDRRATENYLPASAIARAFPNHRYRELGPYDRLGQNQPAWAKADNWRIASEMTREELLSTDLGAFLSQI